MARVKGGVHAKKKHKSVMDRAKGFRGARSRRFKVAKEAVMHAERYAYRDRRARKGDFRRLWITRINAAARMDGLSYSRFMHGLKLAEVDVDRKNLADLAVREPEGFTALVVVAKQALGVEVDGTEGAARRGSTNGSSGNGVARQDDDADQQARAEDDTVDGDDGSADADETVDSDDDGSTDGEDETVDSDDDGSADGEDETVDSDDDGSADAEDESPFGDGSARADEDGSGPEGWTVKGNASSMLYHTEESPYYERTNPEVWFETEQAADAAGFERWDHEAAADDDVEVVEPDDSVDSVDDEE